MSKENNIPYRTDLPQWHDLQDHYEEIKGTSISGLFERDNKRFDKFSLCVDGMMLDYSKQVMSDDTILKLLSLARACGVEEMRDKMFLGDRINITEDRAVLHTALRQQNDNPVMVDGDDIIPDVRAALAKVKSFSDKIRSEKKIKHIINIGIGGSDLGPSMVYEALKTYSDRGIRLDFVSNVDATHLSEVLLVADPETTLFIVTSKTFTTQETMTNANSAKNWLVSKLGKDAVADHFIAATKNTDGAVEFGVRAECVFPIWDWVGGRYSLWSAIAISLAISLGIDNFQEMLNGANAMDHHFMSQPLERNMPVIMGMIGVWHRNFFNYPALSIVPYDQYLHKFTAYMQQVDMESNGKSVDRYGRDVPYQTGPIILGETGTNAQHAFFQSLHQGTQIIPCDFIITANTKNPLGDHHEKLLANVIAQSKAFMDGLYDENPHKSFAGSRPSNSIVIDELTPYNLGMLLSLYEHKIFVQGVIWDINSFDQCGVELGKVLAKDVLKCFSGSSDYMDGSTSGIISYIKSKKK